MMMTNNDSIALAASFLYPQVCSGCCFFTEHERYQINVLHLWLQERCAPGSFIVNYAGTS